MRYHNAKSCDAQGKMLLGKVLKDPKVYKTPCLGTWQTLTATDSIFVSASPTTESGSSIYPNGKLQATDALGFAQEQWRPGNVIKAAAKGVKKAAKGVKKAAENAVNKVKSTIQSVVDGFGKDKTPYTMNGPDGTIVGLGGDVFVLPSFTLKGTYQKHPMYPLAVVWGSGLQYDTSSGKLQDATGVQVGYVSKVITNCSAPASIPTPTHSDSPLQPCIPRQYRGSAICNCNTACSCRLPSNW